MKTLITALGLMLLTTFSIQAQSLERFVENNTNRAIRKTEMHADRKIDKGMNKSLDAAEQGATKAVKSDPQKKEARSKKKADKNNEAGQKED
ncbi:MAG: hypothetical protein HGA37_13525 [Lentimicrobium sp.]|nr:hypothetical protein [Lentimicrobium sp.]